MTKKSVKEENIKPKHKHIYNNVNIVGEYPQHISNLEGCQLEAYKICNCGASRYVSKNYLKSCYCELCGHYDVHHNEQLECINFLSTKVAELSSIYKRLDELESQIDQMKSSFRNM